MTLKEEYDRRKEQKKRDNEKIAGGTVGRKIFDPHFIIQFLLVVCTGGLIYVGLLQKWTLDEQRSVLEKTDRTLRETMITTNRAWISPTAIALVKYPEQGNPIEINLQYGNVGNTPAIDLHERYTVNVPSNVSMDDGSAMDLVDKTDVCHGVEPWKDAEVVFPRTTGVNLVLSIKPIDPKTGKRVLFYDTFLSGGHSLIAQFCIAYKTMETTHKTAFCYFYRRGLTVGLDMNRCDKGNHAN